MTLPKAMEPFYDDLWNPHYTVAAATLRPPYASTPVSFLTDFEAHVVAIDVLTAQSPGFAEAQAAVYQNMKQRGFPNPRVIWCTVVWHGALTAIAYDLAHVVFRQRVDGAGITPVELHPNTGRRIARDLFCLDPMVKDRPNRPEHLLTGGVAQIVAAEYVKELAQLAFRDYPT